MTTFRPLEGRSALAHWWAQLLVSVQGRSLFRFRSLEDLFAAARALIADLERSGHAEAAVTLREGFGSLNGLTDGWAALLDALEKVGATCRGLDQRQRAALRELRDAVRFAVYRP